MSERGRVFLIFAAVGLVAAGGGYYFFEVYQPSQARKAAQDEVTAWEARWKAARDCLMGPKPASSKTSEALAVREMLPDPWQRSTCTPLISKLTRGDAPDTGIAAIEAAWTDLDKAAAKAAGAFATHVSAPVLDRDPLPAALDNLDAARAKLRAAAHLPPATGGGSPLPAATILALADGKEPLVGLDLETTTQGTFGAIPSAHGFVMFGKTAKGAVQIDLIAGGAPHVDRVTQADLRSIPDSGWGATAGSDGVNVGAFDPTGAMPAPASLALPVEDNIAVAAVGGTMADGVVVFGGRSRVAVAHARQAAVTADAPVRILSALAGTDGDGRVALAWIDTSREQHARIVKPGGDEPEVNLAKLLPDPPKGMLGPGLGQPCLSKDRAWMMMSGGPLFGFGGGREVVKHDTATVPSLGGFITMLGCANEGVMFRLGDGAPSYLLCDDTCATGQIPGAPDMSSVGVVGGKLVALAMHGGVLAVYHQAGGAPTFYGLPEAMRLVHVREWPMMALTDGKVLDVLARGAEGYFIVRVPAS
jgi:hypothetical protein